MRKGRQAIASGDYRWAVQILHHLVFADPGDTEATQLQADAYVQLGYQAEVLQYRAIFLTAAKELREGVVTKGQRGWPPHNCGHSFWRGAHMGPAGQGGCGGGFEADLIPAHSPMMSRTRMIDPIPIHRFTGFLGSAGDRLCRRCASR